MVCHAVLCYAVPHHAVHVLHPSFSDWIIGTPTGVLAAATCPNGFEGEQKAEAAGSACVGASG